MPPAEEWEIDTQEYLVDDQDDLSTHHPRREERYDPYSTRFIARGPEIVRMNTHGSARAEEDDIVDSYMHRTPFLDADETQEEDGTISGGEGGSPEFLSPSTGQTERGLLTSPSDSGTHSSPLSRGESTTTGASTGRKWATGLGIGLGVPRGGAGTGAGQSQSQMRRRTPSRRALVMSGEEDKLRPTGRKSTTSGERQRAIAAGKRPTLSARSSMTASSTRTSTSKAGRQWSWLNGLGIAHVFSGTTVPDANNKEAGRGESEERDEDDGDGTQWKQRRVASTNIWGAAATDLRPLESQREGSQHPGSSTDFVDAYQEGGRRDAPGVVGSQGSRGTYNSRGTQGSKGTIRLVPPSTAVEGVRSGDHNQEHSLSVLPDRYLREQEPSSTQPTAESAPFIDTYADGGFERRTEHGGSFSSYEYDRESRTSNNNRDSTGFRHAVLAALGFSSGHTRLPSGEGGHLPDLGLGDQVLSSPDGTREPPTTMPRNDSSALFSLPPNVSQSTSSGPSQPVGLGIAYGRARSGSQFSHPSHTGTWDALYPDHQMGLDLDSDMLDFSSPSGISNSLSRSDSVFAPGQTPGSATRSPAMMSTGPMPHSEQFHVEEVPSPRATSPREGNGWNAEEEKDIALVMATFDPQQQPSQEKTLEVPLSASTAISQRASPISPKRFPLPPQRQLATSPRGLRPRPSESMLRQPVSEEGIPTEPTSEQVADISEQTGIPVATPTRPTADTGASILSPASIYSTNTFGGRQANPLSPPIVGGLDGSTENWSRARFSHLFAGKTSRASAVSASEPISGNSFSSFQQQQQQNQGSAWNQTGQSARTSGPDEARILQPSSSMYSVADHQGSENRWSTVSFPGHPIVSPEIFQNAALGLHSTDPPSTSQRPTDEARPRRRPLPKPISTRSAIEVQRERALSGEGGHGNHGTPLESADLAMGDASSAAQVSLLSTAVLPETNADFP